MFTSTPIRLFQALAICSPVMFYACGGSEAPPAESSAPAAAHDPAAHDPAAHAAPLAGGWTTSEGIATPESVYFQVHCRLPLGATQLLAGRLEEAHTLAERALGLARERQGRHHQAYTLRFLGDIAARRDPPESERAEAHYRQALALAEDLGMRPLVAHCHRGLGMLYLKLGRGAQARPELSAAIEMYRAMDMTFWLPQAEAALAQVG